jgi:hypothetical protein
MKAKEKKRLTGVHLDLVCPRRRGNFSTAAERELGPCQVRSETDRPCPRSAAVKIRGVPFCERCAREQEAYFAIGELTQAQETRAVREQQNLRGLCNGPLAGMPERARWKLVRRIIKASKRGERPFESLAVE